MVNVAILQLCSMWQGEKMSPFQDQRDSWTRPLPPLPDQRDDLATGRTASTSWSQAYKMSQSLRPLETSGLYNKSILKACKTHKKTTANHLPPKQFAKKNTAVSCEKLWALSLARRMNFLAFIQSLFQVQFEGCVHHVRMCIVFWWKKIWIENVNFHVSDTLSLPKLTTNVNGTNKTEVNISSQMKREKNGSHPMKYWFVHRH